MTPALPSLDSGLTTFVQVLFGGVALVVGCDLFDRGAPVASKRRKIPKEVDQQVAPQQREAGAWEGRGAAQRGSRRDHP